MSYSRKVEAIERVSAATLLTVILVFGVWLRSPESSPPPLWLDEAWRAIAIRDSAGVGELLSRMVADSTTLYFGELVFGKVGLWLFGETELAFRVWPFLFSSLAIVAGYAFGAWRGSRAAGIVAAFLLAIGGFVFHAREFKPFAMDLCFAVWTVALAVYWDRRHTGLARIALGSALLVYGASSPTFVVVFPGIAVFVLWRSGGVHWSGVAMLAPAVLIFVGHYVGFLAPQQTAAAFTVQYWDDHLLTTPAKVGPFLELGRQELYAYFKVLWVPVALVSLVLAPALSVWRKDGIWLMLWTPFLLNGALSVLGKFPLLGRPGQFLFGLMVLGVAYVVACGVTAMGSRARESVRISPEQMALLVAAIGVGVFWAGGMLGERAASRLASPPRFGGEVLSEFARAYRPGDVVRTGRGAHYTLLYYKDRLGAFGDAPFDLRPQDAVVEESSYAVCLNVKQVNAAASAGTRLWFVSMNSRRTAQSIREAIEPIARVAIVVDREQESLVLATLERPVSELTCANDHKGLLPFRPGPHPPQRVGRPAGVVAADAGP